MMPLLVATSVLAAVVATHLLVPGLPYRLPIIWVRAWKYVVPGAALLWAATTSPAATVGLAIVAWLIALLGTRTLGFLRRQVAAQATACAAAMDPENSTFPDVAVCVLLERYAARGMGRVEAVAIGGRCQTLDDLGAQVALREGGMTAYGAYLKRFGRLREVADADQAVHGDRFPGGPTA